MPASAQSDHPDSSGAGAGSAYDLVAIGTGTAAKKVALACRRAGWRVAVMDHLPFGGTCALRGCDPKKALWSVSHAYDLARRLGTAGLRGTEGLWLDWPEMSAFKRSFIDPVPAKREALFREEGIDAYRGHARFIGPNTLIVGDQRLEARHILIATGAGPMRLPFAGAEHLMTSDQFFELTEMPKSLVLVGGGYIAFEFAHTATRLGATAIILEREDRCLGRFDRDLVQRLVEKSRWIGIEVHVNTEVIGIQRTSRGVSVQARTGSGEPRSFEAGVAIHAAGRVPALDDLDLRAGHVERDGRHLRLTGSLQSTSNPAVFAAGDAAARGPALTPVASHDAEIVAANLLDADAAPREPDYTGVPSVAFTIPTITSVGLTEEQARAQGLSFRMNYRDISDWQAVRHVQEATAAYKVLIEEGTEHVLGAHILGPDAENTINLFALAIRLRLSARDMDRFMSAFPTAASNVFHML
ncbi:MAG TPA: NAD(P)/FAD-dependent oxidoreductase, partial [Herpetosiphonaceae bacterium]|nr:NAD(P)/FAD-dependent oxidoreductase [Herpetosiphonaceae bacterium]